jgi:chaperonin GroES
MSDGPQLISPTGEALKSELPPERDWTQTQFPIALFNDRIAIKRADREAISEGGIHLPEDARERTMTGQVVAVGPGLMKGNGEHCPMYVEVGDTVLFEQFRHMISITVEGRAYHLMNASDLLGKVVGGVKVKAGS